MANSQNVFVYVATADAERQKIGFSINPANRLANLSGSSGYRLTMSLQEVFPDAPEVEKMAHWLLRQSRLHGEWFGVSAEVAIAAVRKAADLVSDGLRAPSGIPKRSYPKGKPSPNPGSGRVLYRLTAKSVLSITKQGLHADGGGLYLKVDASGAKRWTFVFQWNGSRREKGLGPLRTVSLPEAREAAEQARKMVRNGVDPIGCKAMQRAA